jgi:hypothetical protein
MARHESAPLFVFVFVFILIGGTNSAQISHVNDVYLGKARDSKDCSYLLPGQVLHGSDFAETGEWYETF